MTGGKLRHTNEDGPINAEGYSGNAKKVGGNIGHFINLVMFKLTTHTQGVYVGAGNSPVSSKLADHIRRWEFIDIADLLPEVRLNDREGEPEKLLQRRPHCVTDIWS